MAGFGQADHSAHADVVPEAPDADAGTGTWGNGMASASEQTAGNRAAMQAGRERRADQSNGAAPAGAGMMPTLGPC